MENLNVKIVEKVLKQGEISEFKNSKHMKIKKMHQKVYILMKLRSQKILSKKTCVNLLLPICLCFL